MPEISFFLQEFTSSFIMYRTVLFENLKLIFGEDWCIALVC